MGLIDIDLVHCSKLGKGKYESLDRMGIHLVEQNEEYMEHFKLIVDSVY